MSAPAIAWVCRATCCSRSRPPAGELALQLQNAYGLRLRDRSDAGPVQKGANDRFGFARVDEVHAALNTRGDSEWSVAGLVLAVPEVDLRARLAQELRDRRQMLVGGAVHRRVAVGIDGVQIVAQLQHHLDRFDGLCIGSRLLAG